jgi:hypothetical protein
VSGRDSYCNVADAVTAAVASNLVVSLSGGAASSSPPSVMYMQGSQAQFSVTFETVATGLVTVAVLLSYNNQPVPLSGSAATVTVNGAALSAAVSSVQCPSSVPSASAGRCTVLARDSFGNAAGVLRQDVALFHVSVSASPAKSLPPRVAVSGSSSLTFVDFTTPSSRFVTVSVNYYLHQGSMTALGSPSVVSVVSVAVDAATSLVSCDANTMVGDDVTCVLRLKNSAGGAVPGDVYPHRVRSRQGCGVLQGCQWHHRAAAQRCGGVGCGGGGCEPQGGLFAQLLHGVHCGHGGGR